MLRDGQREELRRQLLEALLAEAGNANAAARRLDTSKYHLFRLINAVGLKRELESIRRFFENRYRPRDGGAA